MKSSAGDGITSSRCSLRRTGLDFRRGSPRIFARGNRAGRCCWTAGFLGDLPFPPPLHSGAAPYSQCFTHIGSQELDVKRLVQTSSVTPPGRLDGNTAVRTGAHAYGPNDYRLFTAWLVRHVHAQDSSRRQYLSTLAACRTGCRDTSAESKTTIASSTGAPNVWRTGYCDTDTARRAVEKLVRRAGHPSPAVESHRPPVCRADPSVAVLVAGPPPHAHKPRPAPPYGDEAALTTSRSESTLALRSICAAINHLTTGCSRTAPQLYGPRVSWYPAASETKRRTQNIDGRKVYRADCFGLVFLPVGSGVVHGNGGEFLGRKLCYLQGVRHASMLRRRADLTHRGNSRQNAAPPVASQMATKDTCFVARQFLNSSECFRIQMWNCLLYRELKPNIPAKCRDLVRQSAPVTSTAERTAKTYFTYHCGRIPVIRLYFDTKEYRCETAAHTTNSRGCGGLAVRLLASHPGEPGSTTGRITSGFSHVGIVPDDVGREGFLGDLTVSPAIAFRRCSIFISFHPRRFSRHFC
ncbi:hypothetical protein PR048_017484 [Dryococelus australis]|uniref:Uncharacterized protein n=1 Tax=Dryococelus australis TaxID=614101 RepID=A0ABQ9H9M0_9NEOP|nr:hypothetical protein PR048_017484 [Dryococelus australis]